LQCVAVCCSVLQCVAVCCSVLQCAAVCCSVLQCVIVSKGNFSRISKCKFATKFTHKTTMDLPPNSLRTRTVALTFDFVFSRGRSGGVKEGSGQNFSTVSSKVNLCSKFSSKLTFANFQRESTCRLSFPWKANRDSQKLTFENLCSNRGNRVPERRIKSLKGLQFFENLYLYSHRDSQKLTFENVDSNREYRVPERRTYLLYGGRLIEYRVQSAIHVAASVLGLLLLYSIR